MKVEARPVTISLKNCIIPVFDAILEDVLNHYHQRYIFPGGRGSTKSSFVGGVCIPLLIMNNPQIHAVCFRKVGNTVQNSIRSQVEWGIYQLGLESLFHIPKSYSNPIVYLPTGQCIYFLGLDDPHKVKSIKPSFGYIGITWFEELDQYNGEEELRNILQSTMRGGQIFWDFRTFNPPISKNNWANEYAEEQELNHEDKALVVRNTYLDVPEDWLGKPFIEEAEELKEKNPRAYEHEYMGVATGTGGDVFPNVCAFDSHQLVDIGLDEKVELWTTFDKIYNGLDWGFAKDPARFVRMHFDSARLDLYIFKEYNSPHIRNQVLYDKLYNEKKLIKRTELLTADSAEPKSVADFKAYGAFIRGAEKGPDSVRYGIGWLQGLNHIYIDQRECPCSWDEFTKYEYEMDKEGNFISDFPDHDNHSIDACRYGLEHFYKRKGN